jgi:multiple sugar transport system substrate-binding protein
MKKIKLFVLLSLIAVLALSACGVTPEPQVVVETVEVVKEVTVVETVEVEKEVTLVETVEVEKEVEVPAEIVNLRIAWWGSQNRHDRTSRAIQLYMQENPNVRIIFEYGGWGDYWTRMNTQAAGGSLPDEMQQDYMTLKEWVDNDLLYPLDEFVDSGILDISSISDQALAGGYIDGKLYAISAGMNSNTIALDVDMFEQAGIPLPAQDWKFADFEQLCLDLYEALQGQGDFKWCMSSTSLMNMEQIVKALYLGYGQWFYSDDGKSLGWTEPQPLIDYLNMLLRLQEAGAMPTLEEMTARGGGGVENSLLVTSEAAMAYIWSNNIVALQAASGEERNIVLTHLPRPEGGESLNYPRPAMFFSVTGDAVNPEEATKFLNWLTNSVEANEILMAERGVPISSSVREGLKPSLTPAQIEMFDFLARVIDDSSPVPPPDPAKRRDVRDYFQSEISEQIFYGLITPEEGVLMFMEEANRILASE